MPNAKSIASVTLLQEKFSRAKAVILANFAGLNSKQQVKLRQDLKNAGGEFIVAKNTLVARVVGKAEMDQSFTGQTGTVFSYEDEIGALKALVKFAKENDVVQLKQGLVGKNVYDAKALEELSTLPGKTELIQMLLGRLNAPASKLVGVLKASQRDLVYALQAIADKKGN
ncbi:MAG: 50S ribosomal protein L10 [Candidatus Woesebacteria bacterium]